jgi:N utilization substance protein A
MLDYLERDRGIERDTIVQVIEEALVVAARKAVGPANELKVKLDPATGEIAATAQLTVVEGVQDNHSEIDLMQARTRNPDCAVGDEIEWNVTPSDFGRIAAQTARQGIMQRLREAQKARVREEYESRLGEVLYGAISRFDRGDVIIDFGRAEATLPRSERVPNEDYQVGDHVCTVLKGLNDARSGPILVVSRSAPLLVQRLFEREVAEIAEGIVEIKAVAREAGFRSKIAVHSSDQRVDPVGACVGVRGSRVKTVVRELNGEKVDIVRWSPDVKEFVTNALQPARIRHLDIDEESHTINVTVDSDQLSLAIGKRGQNARLSVRLTGWKIDINKDGKEEDDFESRMARAVKSLSSALEVEADVAKLLVDAGFLTTEGIAEAELTDLVDIEGLDEAIAQQIKDKVSA